MTGVWLRAAGVFHEIKMSVSVMASTTGDSGDVEMSPRTTRTVAVACPSWLRATTIDTKINTMKTSKKPFDCR